MFGSSLANSFWASRLATFLLLREWFELFNKKEGSLSGKAQNSLSRVRACSLLSKL